jgi:hypothetical protein
MDIKEKIPPRWVSYYVPSIYRRPFPPQDYRHKTDPESEKVNYDTSETEE